MVVAPPEAVKPACAKRYPVTSHAPPSVVVPVPETVSAPVVDTLAAVSACTAVAPHVSVPAMSMVEEASPRSVNVRPAAPTKRLPVDVAPSAMRTIVAEDNPVARFNVPLAVAPE